jgi:hypothetical protein
MVFVMKIVTIVTIMAMIITILIKEIAALRKSMNGLFTIMDTNAINLLFHVSEAC